MTKKDLHYTIGGGLLGLGLFAGFWFFVRKKTTIPEINPALVTFTE